MYEYKAHVVNIVDGDTIDIDVDLGFHVTMRERLRILDMDTPEKYGKEKELGLLCKQYAEKLLLDKDIIIKSYKSDAAAKTDSFGRYLCSVSFEDGSDLLGIYNALGINKKYSTYSEDNVRKLSDLL